MEEVEFYGKFPIRVLFPDSLDSLTTYIRDKKNLYSVLPYRIDLKSKEVIYRITNNSNGKYVELIPLSLKGKDKMYLLRLSLNKSGTNSHVFRLLKSEFDLLVGLIQIETSVTFNSLFNGFRKK